MELLRTRSFIVRAFFLGLILGVGAMYFLLTALADTGIVEPNGNGSIQSSQTGCGAGGAYDCLNDGVVAPTPPAVTGSDYITLTNTKNDYYLLGTIPNVLSVSSVTLYYYHVESGASAFATLGLFAANEVTQYGTTQNIPNRSIAQWDSVTISGLSLTQTNLDDLRVRLDCEKSGGGPSYSCNGYALYAVVTYTPKTNVLVSAVGTQQNIDVGTVDAYVGGAFRLIENENCTSCAIDNITITETGSINAQTDLDNIELWYDLDTTGADGYNCSDESFNGDEIQFGSTDTDGFSGADGTASFTGNVSVSTTQAMCVYTVLDIGAGASAGQTIEIQITDPSADVSTVLNQVVRPTTAIALSGSSVIQAVDLDQIHYHWRDNTGDQGDTGSGSNSLTSGTQDTPYTKLGVETPVRLRLEVSNEGNKTSSGEQYRLEFAKKVSTCDAATGWTDVGATGGDFDMYDSGNLTNGNDTTDILNSKGGVTNENTTFLTPNGGVRDTSSQTGTLMLTSSQFVELEYSIVASTTATEGDTYCFRVTDAGAPIDTYTVYPEATILADLNVTVDGTQPPYIDIPGANKYMGGFDIVDQTGAHTIQSITIQASGTVDYVNKINNIELWYDLDTTGADNYNCSDESYNGDEFQFSTTDTDGFSSSGTSTFSGTLAISDTSSVCLYVVLDVLDEAVDGRLLDISIEDPSTDIVINTGTVSPNSPLPIPGVTTVVEALPTMSHYHWRDDLGSETTAPSATGDEDTLLDLWKIGIPKRLRVEVSNEGSTTTGPYQYRLEYAKRVSTCAAATGWTDVGATADEFDMYNSPNLTDGNDTTNIATTTGGVTDEQPTFLTNNNAVKDTSSQTANITLLGDEFVEMEFSLVASSTATEGSTYCFRVTNAGTPIHTYDLYAEATIKPPTDFYIQRGVATVSGTSLTLTAGTDYIKPSSSSTAFIRITNTQLTGAGDSGAPANSNADDVTAYISNPENIETSVNIVRFGNAGDTRVDWEIIEFTGAPGSNNEIVVRDQSTVTYTTAGTTVNTPTVSGIQDDADVVVFITGQGNPDTARTNYNTGLSTAAWNAGSDTATFTRGEAGGDAVVVSYAVVEFVGSNWKTQRIEHTYAAVDTTETESITAVNSTARAFVHAQKRVGTGLNSHANIGHEVWLSGLGQLSFYLDSDATTPTGHVSVAWVIENTQSNGTPMFVTRSNGTQSGGIEPGTFNISIGKTLNDTEITSIFINNRSSGSGTTFPQPMIAARLLNTTQYELWVSKTTDSRNYRTEIVEWPTGDREITQNDYRFYVDNDALDPTDPWPAGVDDVGDNTPVTVNDGPIAMGDTVRIRMTLAISAAKMNPGVDTFKLQFGEMEGATCTAIGEDKWFDVGDIGSTTALWRGHNGTPVDGTPLSTDPPTVGDLNITAVSDVAGTYEEQNPTAAVPYQVDPGEDVEYDWAIEHNGAKEKVSYCFRMVESGGALLKGYNDYPTMRTAGYTPLLSTWRFYDDETNLTPSAPLANENTAPIDIAFENIMKLRVTVAETTGGVGTDKKFKLQYSEYSDFSDGVFDVVATSTCALTSTTTSQIWCYADGAGINDAVIDAAVLSDADSCTGGVGDGCGTYNEYGLGTTTATTYDQPALTTAEYEFTLVHAGARANAVYYFRLFDLNTATSVAASTSYPSLVTEGASLVFSIDSVPAGTFSEGVTADVSTTPTTVSFSEVPFDAPYEAIYRLSINTNSTEGYQMLMYATQPMTNTYGDQIPDVTGTNASPTGWGTGCVATATACFGYHVGDDTLSGGSTRFSADDTYAAISTTPQEVMYSSVPANESSDIVYKIQVSEEQVAGDYETEIVYLAIPVF